VEAGLKDTEACNPPMEEQKRGVGPIGDIKKYVVSSSIENQE
jgi:hypothetical protein